MDFWDVLLELLILLSAALVLGFVCEWLKQSAIVGYLLAGMLLGPHVLDWLDAGPAVLRGIADLGVALLLFAVGLEFSLKRLLRLGRIGLVGGTVQVVVTAMLGGAVAWMLTGRAGAAVAWGAMVALSSTACVFRVLMDRSAIDSVYGRGAAGILLLQDLAVVPLVLAVGAVGGGGQGHGAVAVHVLVELLLIAGLVVGFYLLNRFVLPPLLRTTVVQRNRELWVLIATILAIGSACAAQAVGISPALGAFIAGVMLAESPFAMQVRADVGVLRTLFMTLFFATIGMLGNPGWMLEHAWAVGWVSLAVIAGKALIVTVVGLSLGMRLGSAVAMGLVLGQVGEFSFVLADVALGHGLLDAELFGLFISVTLISLLATPYLARWGPRWGRAVERWYYGRTGRAVGEADEEPSGPTHRDHVVIIGFGPAGRHVAEALLRRGMNVVAIDLNSANLRHAERMGAVGYLGDGVDPGLQHRAAVRQAAAVVVTLPDPLAAAEVVFVLRWEAPQTPIVVRTRYTRFAEDLVDAGATRVIDEEQAVGRKLLLAVRQVMRGGPGGLER